MKAKKRKAPRDNRDNRDNRRPAKASPTPDDLSVDNPHNWDFTGLPPEEQEACCRWEYARESAFIRDLQQRYADPAWKQPPLDGNDKRDAAKYCKRVKTFAICLELLRQRGVLESRLAAELTRPLVNKKTGEKQCFPRPWLSLTDAERKARIVPPAATVPAFERGSYVDATHISEQAEAAPFTGDGWKIADSSYLSAGAEVGVFRIGWGQWTDPEIKRAFARWIDKHRPQQFRKPTGRPRNSIDPAAALRCLAIMRVLHSHTLTDLSYKFAKVNTTKPKRDLERGRDYFQRLSPIGRDEVPLSWQKLSPRNPLR